MHDAGVYQHSGRLGSGPLVIPVAGMVAAFVLAVVYAYADVYIPIAGWVSFILTAGFALAVGLVVSRAAMVGKCRNTGLVYFLGLVIGLFALYFAWAAFAFVLLQRDMSDEVGITLSWLVFHPLAVWRFAEAVNEHGWYSIGSSTPSGTGLWILWALEAVIIVGGITVLSAAAVKDRVFCERCRKWCQEVKDKIRLADSPDENLYVRLSEGHVQALSELAPVAPTVTPYLRVEVHRCENCPDTSTWQVHLVTHERDKHGRLTETQTALTKPRFLTTQQLEAIDKLALVQPADGGEAEADKPAGPPQRETS